MSFILDALKKSEAERQRASSPGLVTLTASPARKRAPWWIAGVLALLAVNVIVLSLVLWRGSAQRVDAPPGGVQPGGIQGRGRADMSLTAPSADLAPAAAAAKADATEQPAAAKDGVVHVASDTGTSGVFAPEIPVVPSTARPSAAPGHTVVKMTPRLANTDEEENLPSLAEINLGAGGKLPDLHMDIHVFAQRPAERFVFINNRKYREGATLAEGPSVERITRESVILSYQGLRFSLPRQ